MNEDSSFLSRAFGELEQGPELRGGEPLGLAALAQAFLRATQPEVRKHERADALEERIAPVCALRECVDFVLDALGEAPATAIPLAGDRGELRAHLLDGYDKAVPPLSERAGNYSKAGVDVSMQIRFFKVESVDAANGRVRRSEP